MAVTVSPPSRFLLALVSALLLTMACTLGQAATSTAPPKPATPPSVHSSVTPLAPANDSAARSRAPRLEDFIAESGSTVPFMLHADLWQGIDQRAKLDTIVFVLDNGARCCQVLSRDSTWAVDYTWVYPHSLLPPRWYDARSLIHTGDSLRLADDADLKLTFGTLRVGVHAGSLRQATAEAYRLWPLEIPPALRGRLRLKLERAQRALDGKSETESADSPGH